MVRVVVRDARELADPATQLLRPALVRMLLLRTDRLADELLMLGLVDDLNLLLLETQLAAFVEFC